MVQARRLSGPILAIAVMLASLRTSAAPGPSTALPRTLRLEYTLGPGVGKCPTEGTLRNVIGANMTFDPFVAEAPERLLVSIQRKGRKFHGLAEIRDRTGAVLWSFPVAVSDCHLVVDGLGFAIGVALDPPHPRV